MCYFQKNVQKVSLNLYDAIYFLNEHEGKIIITSADVSLKSDGIEYYNLSYFLTDLGYKYILINSDIESLFNGYIDSVKETNATFLLNSYFIRNGKKVFYALYMPP